MGALIKVADTAELKPGAGGVADAAGKVLALFNVGGTFYVLDNTCLHRGGPLGEGELEGTIVTCPWHGWRWDVAPGANTNNPPGKIGCFPPKGGGGSIFVETCPTSIPSVARSGISGSRSPTGATSAASTACRRRSTSGFPARTC